MKMKVNYESSKEPQAPANEESTPQAAVTPSLDEMIAEASKKAHGAASGSSGSPEVPTKMYTKVWH